MAMQDKVMLMHQVEETLKPRMFANLLEEAIVGINEHLDEYDIHRIHSDDSAAEDDCLESFINSKKAEGRAESTIARYQYIIERFMMFAKVRTKDVNTYHIRDYFANEQARGISDSTLEGIRETLSSYFGWLEHEKLIYTNPIYNIGVIKVSKRVRDAISEPDMERLKRSCSNIRDSALLNVLRSTGCRISEVTGMNIDDINFLTNRCNVIGKGDKERTVFIDDVTAMILKEYLATRNDNNEALFINHAGTRLKPGGARNILKRLAQTAGVENVHPHKFRRTLITKLLNNGMPIQEVAIVVGHDNLDTTMGYYASSKSKIQSSYQMYSR